jgi:hypothetical protein
MFVSLCIDETDQFGLGGVEKEVIAGEHVQ